MLTRSSVHWAERIVATISSSALSNLSAIFASGYARSSALKIFRARAFFASRDSGIGPPCLLRTHATTPAGEGAGCPSPGHAVPRRAGACDRATIIPSAAPSARRSHGPGAGHHARSPAFARRTYDSRHGNPKRSARDSQRSPCWRLGACATARAMGGPLLRPARVSHRASVTDADGVGGDLDGGNRDVEGRARREGERGIVVTDDPVHE